MPVAPPNSTSSMKPAVLLGLERGQCLEESTPLGDCQLNPVLALMGRPRGGDLDDCPRAASNAHRWSGPKLHPRLEDIHVAETACRPSPVPSQLANSHSQTMAGGQSVPTACVIPIGSQLPSSSLSEAWSLSVTLAIPMKIPRRVIASVLRRRHCD
jgi:hypothetical protein